MKINAKSAKKAKRIRRVAGIVALLSTLRFLRVKKSKIVCFQFVAVIFCLLVTCVGEAQPLVEPIQRHH
ncbi:hypothetical protein JYU14_02590, partial [Simkania negevensis]|nr:hypothetical protein [Simkania negevensis]